MPIYKGFQDISSLFISTQVSFLLAFADRLDDVHNRWPLGPDFTRVAPMSSLSESIIQRARVLELLSLPAFWHYTHALNNIFRVPICTAPSATLKTPKSSIRA
jgi:hypothetical protein